MDNPRDDVHIKCPGCNVELEVISTTPFEVDFSYEEEWYVDWKDDQV
jgi:hypothetical protein